MDDPWLSSESSNDSCSGDLDRASCILTESHVSLCWAGGRGETVFSSLDVG